MILMRADVWRLSGSATARVDGVNGQDAFLVQRVLPSDDKGQSVVFSGSP